MNKDLTVGKPQNVLWKFCIPLFGSIIFQQLYNIADSLVAGKFIGENALAAVGNSYEITLIFIAFAFGCNMGCSVIVSQLFGAKDYAKMKTAVENDYAANYMKDGSMKLDISRDIFMYSKITKTEKAKSDSASDTHTSSSGETHGGRGGSF